MTKTMKALIISLITLGIVGVSFVAVSTYISVSNTVQQPLQVVQATPEVELEVKPEQNAELIAILKSLGAEHTSDLSIVYGELPYNARGSYANGTVTIGQIDDPAQKNRTIAHEYLHHVWYTVMSKSERNVLAVELNALLEKDLAMQKRVQGYIDRGFMNDSELFTIYCTESSSSYILTIVDECDKYIDRSQLVLTR